MSSGRSSQLGLLLGGTDEVLDVVEVDLGEIGAPGRHRLALEQLEGLQATLQHPLGLVLECGDVFHHLGREPPARGRTRSVGIRPAELVLPQRGELRPIDQDV